MNTRGSFDNASERLFYAKTVIEFIKQYLQINDSIDDLCREFDKKIVVSDISCPALNSKDLSTCNKRTNYKNMFGLCNYHHFRFVQDKSILIGKQENVYKKIFHNNIYENEIKNCRHPRCKKQVNDEDYCAKHSGGDNILCNKKLKNGNKCRRFKAKDSIGNRQQYCKVHLPNEDISDSFKLI